jgi:hypothetical protein
MLITKKMLLALTLIGALVGAGIGALATRATSGDTARAASADEPTQTADSPRTTDAAYRTPEQIAAENGSQFNTTAEQSAYRQGFNEGFTSCSSAQVGTSTRTRTSAVTYPTYRTSARRTSNTRRVYYDYGTQPRGRSFWQKHRDKLTLAIGTGAGAGIGGLLGGKKGAGIGSLVGLGSSALYTYKLRKRARRY